MEDAVILSAVRTAVGRYAGGFKDVRPDDLAAVAISGATPEGDRQKALQDLRTGRIRCIFSADVLGEGVDVPNVDTVLLLRPTQSATVFAQQIGRGLRLSDDKAGLGSRLVGTRNVSQAKGRTWP